MWPEKRKRLVPKRKNWGEPVYAIENFRVPSVNGKMSFDGYFEATEQAFATEKDQLIDRIQRLRDYWDETVELDRIAAKKCDELQTLKKLVSKGHLQILRTREEMLRVKLVNAQIEFRIRQLQNEIWRFLPYTSQSVPTIDYKLGASYRERNPKEQTLIPPDEKFSEVLTDLGQQWTEMMEIQQRVFEDEMNHRILDNEYFAKFVADFEKQNAKSHKNIDELLERLIRRILQEKGSTEEAALRHQSLLDMLERKKKALREKADEIDKTANDRTAKAREKAQQRAKAATNIVREKVRNIERDNANKNAMIKEQTAMLQEKGRKLAASVSRLKRKELWLLKHSDGLKKKGEARVEELEHKLNALISAAAAMESCPNTEHEHLLRVVSTAVGEHAATATSVEEINLKLQMVRNRLAALTKRG